MMKEGERFEEGSAKASDGRDSTPSRRDDEDDITVDDSSGKQDLMMDTPERHPATVRPGQAHDKEDEQTAKKDQDREAQQ